MTTTYYVPLTPDGEPTLAQKRREGTPRFGYRTIALALRATPRGGDVLERHTDGCNDWAGRTVAGRTNDGTIVHY